MDELKTGPQPRPAPLPEGPGADGGAVAAPGLVGENLLAGESRRIGFLFNHDQIHQVAHSLPIAMALARQGAAGRIVVCTTSARLSAEVRRIGGAMIGRELTLVELRARPVSRMLARVFGGLLPAHKLLIYRDNLDFFRGLDLLVVAEKTSLILKTRYGLDRIGIVHTRHGAGDRAIGFDRASAGFDHVLCSGPKIRERLLREVGLEARKVTVVGYPKFDLCRREKVLPKGFDPAKPTVIYNPHPSPHLSSWYRHGREVLDFFLDHPEYQLIFAPHVMLFERRLVVTVDRPGAARPGRIARKYHEAPNIHIDLGSRALTDMTYTQAADIYLGDVSSQIYEFLLEPRPCLFLNSHHVAWQGDPNYLHWQAGPVIDGPAQLADGLAQAVATHQAQYLATQRAMFAQSFDLTGEPSSDRAARAIVAFLADREVDA